MPIEFRCTQCSKLLRTGDDTAGKQARCPECGAVMTVPLPDQTPPQPSQPMGGPGVAPSPFAPAPVPGTPEAPNPYQSPAAAHAAPMSTAPQDIRPTRLDFGDTFARTWAIAVEHWLVCLGAIVLMKVVMICLAIAAWIVFLMMAFAIPIDGIVFGLMFIVGTAVSAASLCLTIGLLKFVVAVARGEEPRFGILFEGTPYLLPVILFSILHGLILTGGLLLLVIPYFIFLLMFSQSFMLIIDRNVGVLDSLSLSRQVMVGNKLTLFLIGLVASIVGSLAVSVTCGLAALFVSPYMLILGAVVYLSVTGQPTMADRYMTPNQQMGGTPFGQPAP